MHISSAPSRIVTDHHSRETWHQFLRRPLTANADYVTFSVIGLPKGTLLTRYTRIFLAFYISGWLHMSPDLTKGVPFRETGSVRFFIMQALAIIFEDAVQALSQRVLGPRATGTWAYVVGYVWVFCFLVWTTPVWMYPHIPYSDPGKDYFIPFTIFGRFLPKKA